MTASPVLDSAGRRRSPATTGGYHAGRPPRNKGMLYPADPPTVEEIVAVMRRAADDRHGRRLRAIIVVLWRGGLRVQEALALTEHDLDARRGSVLVRCGKGGRRREIGMDAWGWEHLPPWLTDRVEMPVGPLFCVIDGPTRGRPWASAAVRVEFRRLAAQAGVRRRFAPHQLRHAHAVELAREGVPLNIIQRQLGHANLGTTSIYLQGSDGSGGSSLALRGSAVVSSRVGREQSKWLAVGAEDSEMALVEGQDILGLVAGGENGDRGVGEADREIGVTRDDSEGRLDIGRGDRLKLEHVAGDFAEQSGSRALADPPGQQVVQLGKHEG